jgi:hypothetical protein
MPGFFLLPSLTLALAGGALDTVPLSWLGIGSGWALAGLFVVAIIRGRIVARSVVEDVRTDRTDRVAEARAETERWRQAYLTEAERGRVHDAQFGQLLEASHVTNDLIRAIPRPRETA